MKFQVSNYTRLPGLKNTLLLLLSFIMWDGLHGQYDIDINIDNYENDSLVLGYFLGDKQLVKDTLIASKKGKFELKGKDTLNTGLYLLLTIPDNQIIQFIINEEDPEFKISYDFNDKTKVTYKGCQENETFNAYVTAVNRLRPRAQVLRDTIIALKEKEQDYTQFDKELNEIDNQIQGIQDDIMNNHPNSVGAKILRSNMEIEVPDFPDAENSELSRYLYYKSHYFDNIDLGDPVSLRIGILSNKVDNYIEKLTAKHPDSIIASVDLILEKMEPAEDTYRFYLSTLLNKYSKSKIISYDEVYVHMVDKYYSQGKTPWVDEETLLKIQDQANKIRPTIIGNIGADLTVFAEDGKTPITLSEIDYEYLILFFWAPDCGHCSKAMPTYVELNERWKDSGVKVFAICTKHKEKTKNCWEKLEEKNMTGFINGADQYHRSRFKMKYNVSKTPKTFILNKEREILIKDLGADQIEEVLIDLIKQDGNEDLIPQGLEE